MSDADLLTPIALTAAQVGELLGIDPATVRRNSAAGTMPKPVKVSAGAVRWRFDELCDWLAAGCPSAMNWCWPQGYQSLACDGESRGRV